MSIDLSSTQKNAIKYPRIAGLISVLLGILIVYFSIIRPIIHRIPGETIIVYSKIGLVGFFFIVVGAVLFLFGRSGHNFLQLQTDTSRAVTGIVMVIILLAYAGCTIYVENFVRF